MCSIKSVQENDEKLAEILRVAEFAAREAGELIKAKTGASVSKTKLSSKDLLTEIDPMCQAIVEQRVREAFPDHKFIGEEGVAPGAAASSEALSSVSSSDWLWIVDPIDGTTNFVHQIPFSVVRYHPKFANFGAIAFVSEHCICMCVLSLCCVVLCCLCILIFVCMFIFYPASAYPEFPLSPFSPPFDSIGVSHKGKLVAGVVMDPFRDELFSG